MSDVSTDFGKLRSNEPKDIRIWIPITIGFLAALSIVALNLMPELERNTKSWVTAGITLLAAALVFFWFLFLSRLYWVIRVAGFLFVAGSAFVFSRVFKVDGTANGTGLPRLTWKWSVKPPASGSKVAASVETNSTANPRVMVFDAADSIQFLGPYRNGIFPSASLSTNWTSTPPRELWRQSVGAGWSSIVVAQGRAFTQEQRGDHECVTCYDIGSGQLLWQYSRTNRFYEWQGGEGPRATPTFQEDSLYAVGATGTLDCLNANTGKLKWSRAFLMEHQLPNLTWGVSASPLVYLDTVVISGGASNGPTLLAYHRQTGEPLWQSGKDKASYASPIIAELLQQPFLLSCNAASLTLHDPRKGTVLLDVPWTNDKWPKASQPVVIGTNQIFLSAGYGSGCQLIEIHRNEQGSLDSSVVWKNLHLKTQFNTAVYRDGFLYGLDDGGLVCVDVATGERKWKEGHYGAGQSILSERLLLIQSESGSISIALAQPQEYVELGRISALNGKTWNYPTLSGRYLLVRNSTEMACYELPVQSTPGFRLGSP